MKKILGICTLLACCAGIFAIDGTAMAVSGKVEIQRPDGDWVELKKGDAIPEGSTISTGFKSQADVKLGGSTLTVHQLTRVTLRELAEGENKVTTDLFLDAGALDANVKPLNNKANGFQIQTPVVTSSVRGTVFSVDGLGNESTTEGSVYNENAIGGAFTANAGESVSVEDGVIVSPFAKTSQNASVNSLIADPASKSSSPLVLSSGFLGENYAASPAVGFVDVSHQAIIETTEINPVIEPAASAPVVNTVTNVNQNTGINTGGGNQITIPGNGP